MYLKCSHINNRCTIFILFPPPTMCAFKHKCSLGSITWIKPHDLIRTKLITSSYFHFKIGGVYEERDNKCCLIFPLARIKKVGDVLVERSSRFNDAFGLLLRNWLRGSESGGEDIKCERTGRGIPSRNHSHHCSSTSTSQGKK